MFFFLKHFVPQLGYSSHRRVIYWFIQLSHPLKAHRRYSVKIWPVNKCMECGGQKLYFKHFSITMNLLRGKQTMALEPNLVCGFFFLIMNLFFRAVWTRNKIEGKVQIFPIQSCTYTCIASPNINIFHQSEYISHD